MDQKQNIAPASGKLGVLLPGMGAVATTCIAGVELVRMGLAVPVGSITQLGRIRSGSSIKPVIKICELLPFANLSDLVFGGWDAFPDDCYTAALKAGVLEPAHLNMVSEVLRDIRPMTAVFDPIYVPGLSGVTHVKSAKSKADLACRLMEDIRRFQSDNRLSRVVMVWCGSTELFVQLSKGLRFITELTSSRTGFEGTTRTSPRA
jgi:myo-inositol-1-phosphate synthase